jgi:hypothetical protein
VNPTLFFSLEPEEFDQATYNSLSDGLKGLIEKSPEYRSVTNGSDLTPPNDYSDVDFKDEDDISF